MDMGKKRYSEKKKQVQNVSQEKVSSTQIFFRNKKKYKRLRLEYKETRNLDLSVSPAKIWIFLNL